MPTGIFSEDRTSFCFKCHLRSFTVDQKSNLFLTLGHSKMLDRPLLIEHFQSSIFEGPTEWFLSKCHFRTYPSDITVLFIFIFHLVNELIVTVIECLLFILFMLQSELQFELQFELQLVTVRERLFFSCQSLMDGITSLSTGKRINEVEWFGPSSYGQWKNEFVHVNSDQIINQSVTRSTMVQVLINQNYHFIKTHAIYMYFVDINSGHI